MGKLLNINEILGGLAMKVTKNDVKKVGIGVGIGIGTTLIADKLVIPAIKKAKDKKSVKTVNMNIGDVTAEQTKGKETSDDE